MARLASPWALILTLVVGCGGDQPTPSTPEPAPTDTGVATPPAKPEVSREIPATGDPANHYLGEDVWLTAVQAYSQGYVYGSIGAQLTPPATAGAPATFYDFHTNEEVERAHYWRTRPATIDEVVPGKLVALMDQAGGRATTYGPPASVDKAYTSRWWIARVVNQRSKADGFVLLAGGYRAAPNALRLLEGDDSPSLGGQGAEDAHFVGEEHWFVARQPLPTGSGYIYLATALAVKPEAPLDGGEGAFIETTTGKQDRFSHVWKTRIAQKADLKKGTVVIAPELRAQGEGKTYRAPNTRVEALSTRWWAVTLDDVSGVEKGTVSGRGYDFEVAALRVVAK